MEREIQGLVLEWHSANEAHVKACEAFDKALLARNVATGQQWAEAERLLSIAERERSEAGKRWVRVDVELRRLDREAHRQALREGMTHPSPFMRKGGA